MFLADKNPDTPWNGFTISSPSRDGSVDLTQVDDRWFRLRSTITYNGDVGISGLEPSDIAAIRTVDNASLGRTDLASVPAPFRWWVNSYGIHTPAALIHDRLIGDPPEGSEPRPESITDQQVDAYFRSMLKTLGVPFFRRWLMWAAVALRTRLQTGTRRRLLMVTWIVLAASGTIGASIALLSREWGQFVVYAAAAAPASLLWGRQFGAGLIIAYVGVPFLLGPAAIAIPSIGLYAVLESSGKLISRQIRHAGGKPPVAEA